MDLTISSCNLFHGLIALFHSSFREHDLLNSINLKENNTLFNNLFIFRNIDAAIDNVVSITNYIRLNKKLLELFLKKEFPFRFLTKLNSHQSSHSPHKVITNNHLNVNLPLFLSLRLLFLRKTLSPTLISLLFQCRRSQSRCYFSCAFLCLFNVISNLMMNLVS